MIESKVSVWVIAPDRIQKPFRVTIRSACGGFERTEYVKANEKAEIFVPEGSYTLRVRSSSPLNPGGQCKPIHVCGGQAKCYCVIFRGNVVPGETVTVDVYAVDANYPGIIPINGGMTVWRRQPEP